IAHSRLWHIATVRCGASIVGADPLAPTRWRRPVGAIRATALLIRLRTIDEEFEIFPLGRRKRNSERSPLTLDPAAEDQVDRLAPLVGVHPNGCRESTGSHVQFHPHGSFSWSTTAGWRAVRVSKCFGRCSVRSSDA